MMPFMVTRFPWPYTCSRRAFERRTRTGAGASRDARRDPLDLDGVAMCSAGYHSVCVTTSGDVYTFGIGTYGRLGHGTKGHAPTGPTTCQNMFFTQCLIVCSSKTRALLEQDAKRQKGETSAGSSIQETLHAGETSSWANPQADGDHPPDLCFDHEVQQLHACVHKFTPDEIDLIMDCASAEERDPKKARIEGARPASGMMSVEMEQAIRAAYHAGYADREQNKQPTPDPERYLLQVIPQPVGKSG